MNPYSFLIPRLNGNEIEERFDYYAGLVRKGAAGFIVFGGEVESLRHGIKRLQGLSGQPLIIASDLESGLGQQVRGGTLYPPATAIAKALSGLEDGERYGYLERMYTSIASESLYTGINTILAPVLDINSNPENPIIATRSFGEDPETVSFYSSVMIKILKGRGIITCGKHFPGHGDTDRDSHQELPIINKGLVELEEHELIPFKRAIASGVDVIMLGHLSVPCLEPSGRPATVSTGVVSYLRDVMAFRGLIITDAMNMGGISLFPEDEATIMALSAGVDLILHPSDPERVSNRILAEGAGFKHLRRLNISRSSEMDRPDFSSNRDLAQELFYRSITLKGKIRRIENPCMVVLSDEEGMADYLTEWFRNAYGCERVIIVNNKLIPWHRIPKDRSIVVSVFSEVRGWKKKSRYFDILLEKLEKKVDVFLSFGNPYLFYRTRVPVLFAYSTSEEAQAAMVRYITERRLFS